MQSLTGIRASQNVAAKAAVVPQQRSSFANALLSTAFGCNGSSCPHNSLQGAAPAGVGSKLSIKA